MKNDLLYGSARVDQRLLAAVVVNEPTWWDIARGFIVDLLLPWLAFSVMAAVAITLLR